MDTQDHQQLVINDPALIVWAAGTVLAIVAALSLLFFPTKIMIVFPLDTQFLSLFGISIFKLFDPIILISGLVMLLFYPDLTMIADRPTRSLRLEYRYLFFHASRVIPFDDIKNVHVEKSRHSSHGNPATNYRIAATLKNGTTIPFRAGFYREGGKTRHAARLQAFINRKPKAQPGETGAGDQPDETGGPDQLTS